MNVRNALNSVMKLRTLRFRCTPIVCRRQLIAYIVDVGYIQQQYEQYYFVDVYFV